MEPGPEPKPWGGRFTEPTHALVERFTASVAVDARLLPYDVAASKAHARMLAATGLLTAAEAEALVRGLDEVQRRLQSGELPLTDALEDIHMHVEAALVAALGDTGRKLHTARSRNDQVATSLRLWTRDAIDDVVGRLTDLQAAFVAAAERERGVVLPAYTHLQRAQPVLAAHYFLAHVERLERDRERLLDARRRVNVLPLGTAALAGTSLPIDREAVRRELGFAALARNSLDASADRDFVAETLFALSLVSVHLSGWAEEWILWSTSEFGILELPDALCTGSSIMPQKKNPDVLELIRGRTGRVAGDLAAVLMLLKGLPLAYNRDLQEDKPPLFDAVDTVSACLEAAALVVAGARLCRDRLAATLETGFLDATTLMEELVRRGLPMRTAHGVVGGLVRVAISAGTSLAGLPAQTLAAAHPLLSEPGLPLGAANAVAAFTSEGSTGPARVAAELARWQACLALRAARPVGSSAPDGAGAHAEPNEGNERATASLNASRYEGGP